MGLFGGKKEGGLMDVIRCDESDYLIWKWSPSGEESKKENAIRYGSSLRVKDGEVAVFVYRQKDGSMQDFIEGPFDMTIKTANFPALTSIVGSAFGGSSPFQAEIYFINLQGNIRMPLYLKRVNITDPRMDDFPVPASVKGSVLFNITDYRKFIKLNRLQSFNASNFLEQIGDSIQANISSLVGRSPKVCNLSIFRIDSFLLEINKMIENELRLRVEDDYGVNIKQVNLATIVLDDSHTNFARLDKILKGRTEMIADEQANAATRDIESQRQLNLDLRQRMNEEAQRSQKLQTETSFIGAHQINVQGDVAKTAAASLGELGGGGFGGGFGGDGGMNPAGMMTGMMMGTAVGGAMTNMMGNMVQGINTPQPPPPPQESLAQYHIITNGQQVGPYTVVQMKQLVSQGVLTLDTYIWKQGMANWLYARDVAEVSVLFAAVPPPPPPVGL